MKFKINDKVRIRKDTFLYDTNKENPKNTNGIINIIECGDNDIYVNWENGRSQWYIEDDLEYFHLEPLKELHVKIISNKNNYSIMFDEYVIKLINENKPLEDKEIKQCRVIWEKYNKE